jgi:hypothetical protein
VLVNDICLLAPNGMIGTGFQDSSLEAAMRLRPEVIACDAGSTDQGPGSLGSGALYFPREACKHDIERMLVAARKADIPLLIGTAGGSGAEPHVEAISEVIREIASENRLHFRMATVYSDVSAEYLHERVDAGATFALSGDEPALTHERVDECNRIVGVMGVEPHIAAMEGGADVVLAGRSSDAALFAAYPIMRGKPEGASWHAGKVLECGALSAVPNAGDCLLAWVGDEAFEVEPPDPARRCTPLSVAAHTMYENASPFLLREPSGTIDTEFCSFDAVNDRRVRVAGSAFRPADAYSIKLEGTRLLGYRSMTIGVTQDPALIADVDGYVRTVVEEVTRIVGGTFASNPPRFEIQVQQVGRNSAIVTPIADEPVVGRELGLLISVVSDTQQLADEIIAVARHIALHSPLGNWHGLMSNLAFPFAPQEISLGPAYSFHLHHAVHPQDWRDVFQIEVAEV